MEDKSCPFEDPCGMADTLRGLGWRPANDAQISQLKTWCGQAQEGCPARTPSPAVKRLMAEMGFILAAIADIKSSSREPWTTGAEGFMGWVAGPAYDDITAKAQKTLTEALKEFSS